MKSPLSHYLDCDQASGSTSLRTSLSISLRLIFRWSPSRRSPKRRYHTAYYATKLLHKRMRQNTSHAIEQRNAPLGLGIGNLRRTRNKFLGLVDVLPRYTLVVGQRGRDIVRRF